MATPTIRVQLTRAQIDETLAALSNWRLGLWDNGMARRATVCDRAHRTIARALLDAKTDTLAPKVKA